MFFIRLLFPHFDRPNPARTIYLGFEGADDFGAPNARYIPWFSHAWMGRVLRSDETDDVAPDNVDGDEMVETDENEGMEMCDLEDEDGEEDDADDGLDIIVAIVKHQFRSQGHTQEEVDRQWREMGENTVAEFGDVMRTCARDFETLGATFGAFKGARKGEFLLKTIQTNSIKHDLRRRLQDLEGLQKDEKQFISMLLQHRKPIPTSSRTVPNFVPLAQGSFCEFLNRTIRNPAFEQDFLERIFGVKLAPSPPKSKSIRFKGQKIKRRFEDITWSDDLENPMNRFFGIDSIVHQKRPGWASAHSIKLGLNDICMLVVKKSELLVRRQDMLDEDMIPKPSPGQARFYKKLVRGEGKKLGKYRADGEPPGPTLLDLVDGIPSQIPPAL